MQHININQLITNKLIEQLKNGVVPWRKPWVGTWNGAYSRVMKKPYSLSNQLLLNEPGEYLTYTQISCLGGNVKKGERASVVIFWKPIKISNDEDEEERRKRIQAEENGEAVGALLGLAAGAVMSAYDDQSDDDDGLTMETL